jgi:basic membrane protein A and related proteins
MYKNLVAAFAATCFFASIFTPIRAQSPNPSPSKEPLKIGFVYVAPLTDAGWVRQHDEGRKAVDAALGAQVKTSFVENVPEGADAERVIRDLAQQGNTFRMCALSPSQATKALAM